MTIPYLKRYLYFLYRILVLVPSSFCYNLDTNFPIAYQEGSPGDYFGFSVGLLRTTDGYKALITAPRANSSAVTQLHQPGALFSCDITVSGDTATCDEVNVDNEGNIQQKSPRGRLFTYTNKRDDMWLGVSLDIQQSSKDNNVVVCGHLWKNQERRDRYFINGACYVMNSDLHTNTVKKLIPFVDSEQKSDTRKYYYEDGQAGASAAFSEDGEFLLLGGPGFSHMSGTIVSYKLDPSKETPDLKSPIIADTADNTSANNYIGYSITSGKFFGGDTTYSAVGAPRDGIYHGRVYLFQHLDGKSPELVFNQTKEGEQLGEYFGASVSGIDLNDDGFTDLLVGAPFYSDESGSDADEGRVYFYRGSEKGLEKFAEINGQNKPHARFGTCIGNTGDLNQDGFNDVAIGAPYEDETGAIYIYHGTNEGLNVEYVQRIGADKLYSMFSGFGISISRGLDIDNNSYPDLLIGSYASSNAVLLRTYPVIQLSSTLQFYPSKINRDMTDCEFGGEKLPCFKVTYCLRYSGKHVPPSLEFKTELEIDTQRRNDTATPRGFFLSDNQQRQSVSQRVKLQKGPDIDSCFHETAYINSIIKDEATPVQFSLKYDLDHDAMPDCKNGSFSKYCPVIDPTSSTSNIQPLHFEIDCGDDNICLANLVVQAHVLGNPNNILIIGQDNFLTLDVTVSNKGETAYGAELIVCLPSEFALVKHDQCDISNVQDKEEYANNTLRCVLDNFIKKGKEVNIQITIDVTNIPVRTSTLHTYFVVNTYSEEADKTDNELHLPVFFDVAADINITGNPEDKKLLHTDEKIPILVTHKYYMRYYGPSPVDEIDINLYVPTGVKQKSDWVPFLSFTSLETDGGEIATKCNVSYVRVNPIYYGVMRMKGNISDGSKETEEENEVSESGSSNNSRRIRKRSVGQSTTSTGKRGEDLRVDCQTARIKCEVIHCVAGPFVSGHTSIKIIVSAQINLAVLSKALEPWNSIEFITKGKISMRGVKMLSEKYRNETTVETLIMRPGPPVSPGVQQWIIFVSIGVGVVLLIIILIVLFKTGFFKRKQRETMKRMMLQANLSELQSQATGGTEETADSKGLDSNAVNNQHQ